MAQTAANGTAAAALGAPPIITGGQITEDVQRTLHELAERVAEYNAGRRELEKKASEVRDRMLHHRAQALQYVHGERDGAGKPIYTNAEAREAALITTLKDSMPFQEIEAERRAVQDEYDKVAVEYSLLKDRLNIVMAAAGVAQPVFETSYATLFAAAN
jgi:hypothetical protein